MERTASSSPSSRRRRSDSALKADAAVGPPSIFAVLGAFLVVFLVGVVHLVSRLPDHVRFAESDGFLRPPSGSGGMLVSTNRLRRGGGGGGGWTAFGRAHGLPRATWPVSVSRDTEEYDEIIHPADPSVSMFVPEFWSRPVHNNTLMKWELASSIGTCARADTGGNHVRGADCPQDERTIFVSLASYRDYHCKITLESLFKRAAHPERIRVAVVDQVGGEDALCHLPTIPCSRDRNQVLCKHRDQIDPHRMTSRLAIGPPFARHVANRFYRGEYYVLQVDAQAVFAANWDRDVVQQHEATGDEMAVLSSSLTDVVGAMDESGEALSLARPVVCETHYYGKEDLSHLDTAVQPVAEPSEAGVPEVQPFWSAAFSFARGHFLVNVPYDMYQPMIFSGEEISIAIRGFTAGYDFFSLGKSVCFHTFATGENEAKRKSVPVFWENEEHYKKIDKHFSDKAMKRLIGIIKMSNINPHDWNHVGEERYGIGKARETEVFFKTFGINAVRKTHEHNLCDIVKNGEMHNMFKRHMRPDGMGIDYGKFSYSFKDPRIERSSKVM